MRVIAGQYGGRRLQAPPGAATRPTADRVREALFSILGARVTEARVLDLFAGAGGVGLEALSRGAGHATRVERDARALAALRANVEVLGLGALARVRRGDVLRELLALYEAGERFDVVFLDPPYEAGLVAATLQALGGGGLLMNEAVVVAQHFTKQAPAATVGALATFRARRFGETTLTFYRAGPAR
jgi:16S rRNA (guanine966-N2)-methyltransferase